MARIGKETDHMAVSQLRSVIGTQSIKRSPPMLFHSSEGWSSWYDPSSEQTNQIHSCAYWETLKWRWTMMWWRAQSVRLEDWRYTIHDTRYLYVQRVLYDLWWCHGKKCKMRQRPTAGMLTHKILSMNAAHYYIIINFAMTDGPAAVNRPTAPMRIPRILQLLRI